MYEFRLIALSVATFVASASLVLAQNDEEIANRLLIDALASSNGATDPMYKRRLLSALVEEYPETAAARSVAAGLVSLVNLPKTPDWQQLLVADSVITGHSHGDFPALGRKLTHPGVDIGLPGQADCGLPVTAPLTGTVVRVVALDVPDEDLAQIGIDRAQNLRDLGTIDGSEPKSGIGNSVILRHGASEPATFSIYLHMQETPASSQNVPWRVGMTVPAGEQIGKVGTTGNSYGCHLHFEARNFEGKFKYLHPTYENIYPSGDISDTDIFRNDWIAPDVFLRRAFIDRHLAANKPSTPTASAIPEPELPGTHAESTAQIQHTSVPVAEATESQAPTGEWVETSEARRTIRPGETAGDIVVAADGSASYRAAKLFPAARFPSDSELRLYLSPQGRHGLVYQWDLDYGGQRVALIDLTTRRIVRNDFIPESAVSTQAAPQDVRIAMSSVAWSPDGRHVAFALSPGEWQADPVLVDTSTGASTTLFTDDLQPGQWTFPRLETLRSDGENWIELTYEVLACADTDCEAPEVVRSISGGHRLTASLSKESLTPEVDRTNIQNGLSAKSTPTGERNWTSAIVVNPEIYMPCQANMNASCIKKFGGSDEAVQFFEEVLSKYGGGLAVSAIGFKETGKVDIVQIDTGTSQGTVSYFVNADDMGLSFPNYPERDLNKVSKRRLVARSLLAEFPDSYGWQFSIGGMRVLADGNQRFSLLTHYTEDCRACRVIGTNIWTIDFDINGEVTSNQSHGILDQRNLPDIKFITTSVLQQHPELVQFLLNLRGYEAGPIDGAIGPQTRKALADFQRENGVNSGTGYPDRATYLALADSTTMFKNGVNRSEKPNTHSAVLENSQLLAETSPLSTPPSGLVALDLPEGVYAFEPSGCPVYDVSERNEQARTAAEMRVTFERGQFTQGKKICPILGLQETYDHSYLVIECDADGEVGFDLFELWPFPPNEFLSNNQTYTLCAATQQDISSEISVNTPDFRGVIDGLDYIGAADKAATTELLQIAFTLIGGMEPDGTAALLGISAKNFAAEFALNPQAILAVVGSDIAVSAGKAAFAEAAGNLVAGYMFASGPLAKLPDEWQVPLRAFVDATIVESVGLLAAGTDPTGASLVGPIVDRLHDVYEIYQATNALSRTQASGLFAIANGAEMTAKLVREHPSEKAEALKTDWFAMTRKNLPDIVGADDAGAAYKVTVLGYRALDALGRGDIETAKGEIERMLAVGGAAQGLTPLSAEGPIDLLVRLASGGNDSPTVLAETFLKSTSLSSLHPNTNDARSQDAKTELDEVKDDVDDTYTNLH